MSTPTYANNHAAAPPQQQQQGQGHQDPHDSKDITKLNINAKAFTPGPGPAAPQAATTATLQSTARPFVPANMQPQSLPQPPPPPPQQQQQQMARRPATTPDTRSMSSRPTSAGATPAAASASLTPLQRPSYMPMPMTGMPMPMPMPGMPMPPMPGMPMPGMPPGFYSPPGMQMPGMPGGMPMFPPGMMAPPGMPMFPPGMVMPPGMFPPGMPGGPNMMHMPMGMHGLPGQAPPPGMHPMQFPMSMMPPGFMPPPPAPAPVPAMAQPRNGPGSNNAGQAAAQSPPMAKAPAAGGAAAPSARISVGNASLAALNSKEPPKFSCVLLSGLPASGKTTLGRDLVSSLKSDGMGWAFFSGADFLAESSGKRTFWDTTKEVFDALSRRLDDLIEQQKENRNIKGLAIDKNCKGIEDIYYLSALLKAKNIPFVGIVGMECDDDAVLIQRMGGDEELREKLKYHRVIHARVISLAKAAGMYRFIDAAKSKDEVVQSLRTMVLGCCAQPPARGIRTHHYDESRANVMVDNYTEYSQVMAALFSTVNHNKFQFPCATAFTPFSDSEMNEKGRVNALKSRYGVRRKVDGQRFILMLHAGRLYLVPPHMRAVLSMPAKAWLGSRLDTVGSFVLEGDLTRLTKERKEKFLVYDAQHWGEADQPGTNALLRMTWSERQACLASHLAAEGSAFYPPDTDCLVVHHATQKLAQVIELLDSDEYPSSGVIFQPVTAMHRSDHVLVWRQPSCITVDFRVGAFLGNREGPPSAAATPAPTPTAAAAAATANAGLTSPIKGRRGSTFESPHTDQPIRVFALEVYDKAEKRYEQFEDATIEVRHPDVVAGCIITCSLKDETKHGWFFNRIRYDVLRPAYKHDLDELLAECLVPRAKLVSWLITENMVTVDIPKDSPAAGPAAGPAASQDGLAAAGAGAPPPPSYGQATGGHPSLPPAMAMPSGPAPPMGLPTGMPSAAAPPPHHNLTPMAAAPAGHGINTNNHYPTASSMLSGRAAAAPVAQPLPPPPPMPPAAPRGNPAEQIQLLASMVPSLHVVRKGEDGRTTTTTTTAASAAAAAAAAASNKSSAAEKRPERVDKSDKGEKGEFPTMTCGQCHRRKQREEIRQDDRDGRFYCLDCWIKTGYAVCTKCAEFRQGKGTVAAFTCNHCARSGKGGKEGRDSREPREGREAKDGRDGRENRESREPREGKEGRDGKRATGKEGREGRKKADPTATAAAPVTSPKREPKERNPAKKRDPAAKRRESKEAQGGKETQEGTQGTDGKEDGEPKRAAAPNRSRSPKSKDRKDGKAAKVESPVQPAEPAPKPAEKKKEAAAPTPAPVSAPAPASTAAPAPTPAPTSAAAPAPAPTPAAAAAPTPQAPAKPAEPEEKKSSGCRQQ